MDPLARTDPFVAYMGKSLAKILQKLAFQRIAGGEIGMAPLRGMSPVQAAGARPLRCKEGFPEAGSGGDDGDGPS